MRFKSFFLLISGLLVSNLVSAQDKKSTALPNVTVLEEPLTIPGLDRSRTLRIYLPPGYESSNKRYPVMYMHDGQNLFDDATSFVGEWGVDENLKELSENKGFDLIVVGIDNGQQHRNTELTAWPNEHLGEPEGEEYMKFVVEVVKPFVDGRYRTKPDRKNTAIMGSSLGGLISHYAIYSYPEVFSKAGIFSPSYWVSEDVFSFTESMPIPKNSRLYMIVGKKEGPGMTENMERMFTFIQERGHPEKNIFAKTDPEGEHNEAFWRREFKQAVQWLFKIK